jgi:long-chain fatty acid transport protein
MRRESRGQEQIVLRRNPFCVAACALLSLMAAAAAPAGNPAFTGLAASADTAQTASSNPAGMSRLDQPSTTLRVLLANGFGEFEIDESLTTTSGGNPDSEFSPVVVPLAYHARPIGEGWYAGISLTVPTGFGADLGGSWAGRYYSDYYSLVYISLTPALSFRVNERFSFGAGLSVNYTLSETKVAVRTLGIGSPDGRLVTELDGIGTSITLGALWELSPRTRLGLVYTGDSKATLKGDLEFRNPGPILGPLLEERGLLDARLRVRNVLPQRVLGGIHHELESGAIVNADAMWMQFSRFGTASVSLEDVTLVLDERGNFKDIWAGSVGYAFPARDARRYRVGAFYLSSPVEDDKRGFALALDRTWGFGAGVEIQRSNGHAMDLNLTLIDYGKAPVDTGPSLIRGRVVAERETPYAVVLDFAYHF